MICVGDVEHRFIAGIRLGRGAGSFGFLGGRGAETPRCGWRRDGMG